VLEVLPFAMVAVTVMAPDAVVVSVFPLMAAPVLSALLTDHTIVLLLALEGATFPKRVMGVFTRTPLGMPVISVTATKALAGVSRPGPSIVPPSTLMVPVISVISPKLTVTSKDTDWLLEGVRVNLLLVKLFTFPVDVEVAPSVGLMVSL